MAENVEEHMKPETQRSQLAGDLRDWAQATVASAKTHAWQMTDGLGDWTQETTANVNSEAGRIVENRGGWRQQVVNMAKDGIQMVKNKSQEPAKEPNGRQLMGNEYGPNWEQESQREDERSRTQWLT